VIYVDTSVALAHLLAEDRRPPVAMWNEVLVSSRLLEFELWTRIQARGLGHSHGEHVRALIERIGFLEVVPDVVGRAAERFPAPVRTLDALHLATMDFVRRHGQRPRLAAYDARMLDVARRLGIELYPL
ncbi:MAG: PIN domain-containing protein, partial [Longimicrobiales bacterium]